jgi:hypothetical protein
VPEGVEPRGGRVLPCVGEVEGDQRGGEGGVPQGALDAPRVHTRFAQRGGVRMAQGMESHTGCGQAGARCGCAAGALDAGATHGHESRRAVVVSTPRGGTEPGCMTLGFPVGS